MTDLGLRDPHLDGQESLTIGSVHYRIRPSTNFAGLVMIIQTNTGRRIANRDPTIRPHRRYFTRYAAAEEIRLLNAGIVEVSYAD